METFITTLIIVLFIFGFKSKSSQDRKLFSNSSFSTPAKCNEPMRTIHLNYTSRIDISRFNHVLTRSNCISTLFWKTTPLHQLTVCRGFGPIGTRASLEEPRPRFSLSQPMTTNSFTYEQLDIKMCRAHPFTATPVLCNTV